MWQMALPSFVPIFYHIKSFHMTLYFVPYIFLRLCINKKNIQFLASNKETVTLLWRQIILLRSIYTFYQYTTKGLVCNPCYRLKKRNIHFLKPLIFCHQTSNDQRTTCSIKICVMKLGPDGINFDVQIFEDMHSINFLVQVDRGINLYFWGIKSLWSIYSCL